MDKNDLSGIRVLLVGMRGHGAQILRTVMTAAGISRIVSVEETLPALEMLCGESFDAVLVEGLLQHDGVPFAIAARRTEALLNPMIPIFVVYANARRRDVATATHGSENTQPVGTRLTFSGDLLDGGPPYDPWSFSWLEYVQTLWD